MYGSLKGLKQRGCFVWSITLPAPPPSPLHYALFFLLISLAGSSMYYKVFVVAGMVRIWLILSLGPTFRPLGFSVFCGEKLFSGLFLFITLIKLLYQRFIVFGLCCNGSRLLFGLRIWVVCVLLLSYWRKTCWFMFSHNWYTEFEFLDRKDSRVLIMLPYNSDVA